jgi:hypothetical protein
MALTAPSAVLTGSTIASSFDQLLFLDATSGLTEATLKVVSTEVGKSALQISDEHVLIKGVDTSNAAAFAVHTTAGALVLGVAADTPAVTVGVDDTGADVRVYSATASEGLFYDSSEDELGLLLTTKLKFHDIGGGEEIYASANGHLEVNAGTTLDMTAPTVDINASTAVTVDGSAITISKDTDAEFVASILVNQSDAADTTGIISQRFDLEDTGGNAVDSGKILVGKEASFTATGSTQDSYMALHTSLNGTLAEKMRIDSSGNVGIGTASPEGKLNIFSASAGSVTPESTYDELVIENSDHAGIIILTPADKKGGIGFGSPTDAGRAELQYAHASDDFILRSQSTNLMVISTSGCSFAVNVGIGTSSPGQLLDVNQGGGNMIADGYDTHSSFFKYKQDLQLKPPVGFLEKITNTPIYKFKKKPFVSADEIKEAVLEEFGEDVLIEEADEVEGKDAVYEKQYSVWDELFPEDDSHRQKALYNMPDGDLKTWIDEWCSTKREERTSLPLWNREYLGLIYDDSDTVSNMDEIFQKEDDGETVKSANTNSYIAMLHLAVQELSAKVEALENA